jgi:hypothetical protein
VVYTNAGARVAPAFRVFRVSSPHFRGYLSWTAPSTEVVESGARGKPRVRTQRMVNKLSDSLDRNSTLVNKTPFLKRAIPTFLTVRLAR